MINPFRYRSYYYDKETKLYYLNSRYYNPEWGRFINADGYLGSNNDILSYNLYIYASNNPINNCDIGGNKWLKSVGKFFVNTGKAIQAGAKATYNFVKKEVKNTVDEVKALPNYFNDHFVFETEVGLGAGINIGVGNEARFEVSAHKSVGYSYEKQSQYTSTAASISGKLGKSELSASIDYRNYSNEGNPMEMPWEIKNLPTADIEKSWGYRYDLPFDGTVGWDKLFNKQNYFIGVELGGYVFAGGNIKIGFNI